MQMFEALRTYIKSLVLEQKQSKEQVRSEEQEIDSIKDLFQQWIDEYGENYSIHRKKVYPGSWDVIQMSVKEFDNFIFISLSFKEWDNDDWFVVIYNKKNKSIYYVNTKVIARAFPYTLTPNLTYANAATRTFTLTVTFTHYVENGYLNKFSVGQFQRVMDITKGNYAQFEIHIERLSDLNKRNANT
jgi:hypothetical protein